MTRRHPWVGKDTVHLDANVPIYAPGKRCGVAVYTCGTTAFLMRTQPYASRLISGFRPRFFHVHALLHVWHPALWAVVSSLEQTCLWYFFGYPSRSVWYFFSHSVFVLIPTCYCRVTNEGAGEPKKTAASTSKGKRRPSKSPSRVLTNKKGKEAAAAAAATEPHAPMVSAVLRVLLAVSAANICMIAYAGTATAASSIDGEEGFATSKPVIYANMLLFETCVGSFGSAPIPLQSSLDSHRANACCHSTTVTA